MQNLGLLGMISLVLVLIGGINWFFVGLFNTNLVALIFGTSLFARLIYILVGVSAGYLIYLWIMHKNLI